MVNRGLDRRELYMETTRDLLKHILQLTKENILQVMAVDEMRTATIGLLDE